MKLFGISKEDCNKKTAAAHERGYEQGYKEAEEKIKYRVEELEESLDNKKKEIKKLNRQIADRDVELEVLNKQKSDARKVVEDRIENENTSSELSTRQSRIYKREEALDKREEELNARATSEDDKRYKEGYADGVSDGVRKIGEITAADRKDAMDVAKISAASHSNSETVKAVLDGKVETSLKDKKAK